MFAFNNILEFLRNITQFTDEKLLILIIIIILGLFNWEAVRVIAGFGKKQ